MNTVAISRTWVYVGALALAVAAFYAWQYRSAIVFAYDHPQLIDSAGDVVGSLSALGVSL